MMARLIDKGGAAASSRTRAVLAMLLLVTGMFAIPANVRAQSLMSEADARQAIMDRYGVDVLRIAEAERGGVPVFIMKVMNPAGNYNEAFQVNVLVMNRRNGELMPQFQHGVSGVTFPGDGPRQVDDDSGPALREGTFR